MLETLEQLMNMCLKILHSHRKRLAGEKLASTGSLQATVNIPST